MYWNGRSSNYVDNWFIYIQSICQYVAIDHVFIYYTPKSQFHSITIEKIFKMVGFLAKAINTYYYFVVNLSSFQTNFEFYKLVEYCQSYAMKYPVSSVFITTDQHLFPTTSSLTQLHIILLLCVIFA